MPNKPAWIIFCTFIGVLIPTICFFTIEYTRIKIELLKSKENEQILRDSIGKQSRKELELREMLKDYCKLPKIETTKKYKQSKNK